MNVPVQRLISLATALLAVGFLLATPATAALQRYKLNRQLLNHQADLSPEARFEHTDGVFGVALLDESGANPILRRYIFTNPGSGTGLTVIVPELSGGFAWFKGKTDGEGPAADQSGTGSSASTIDWGRWTGWTTSGVTFCHSIPSYICSLADLADNVSSLANNRSTTFDIGEWVFHGTGWTHPAGRVFFTSPTNFGNSQQFARGAREDTGVVPALPLIGVGSVALSVFALGLSAARRRRS